tara:strand:+ start:13327 stop:13641 length:315 start_codon:yes stop_codon:yes gene_type:complete
MRGHMNAFETYLNDLKVLKGFSTEGELAEYLGLRKQEISRAKKRGYATDEQCIIVARELGVHPALVILARETIKDKNSRHSKIWEDALSASKQVLRTNNKDYRK